MKDRKGYSESVVITQAYRGEVCEKKNVFDQSLFRRVYKRAYDILQEQVNLQVPQRGGQEITDTADNIIVFMGRRGTGKSSAMKSFMSSLLENNKAEDSESDGYKIQLKDSNKKVRFIGVDSIDASLLEREEDIFEAILAKLFNEFLKDDVSNNSMKYENKELYNRFSSIYKKHLNIKQRNNGDVYSSEAAISNLRDLARSVDIRLEFEELIEKYIQVKSHRENEYNGYDLYETFLVISIDDIDMNVEAGFEILEKIQRYLKVKRLIVLLAVNHEQMKLCCQKHFENIISSKRGMNINNLNYYINELTDQYMEKTIPSYSRVYLPSLKKMDYDRNNNIRICDSKDKSKEYSIKWAMFFETWRKTGVRYDTKGKKRHFLEPESLRELNNWRIYRNNMPELGTIDSEGFLERLDFNHRRTMDDLLFRYADEVLQNQESKLFISLSELHIGRRGREIVSDFLHKHGKDEQEEGILDQLRVDSRDFGYSYGELLRVLYYMGRTHIYDKKLVHAILAMYSLTLTKIFYRYKSECLSDELEEVNLGERQNENHNYKILKEIMNGSVGGSWARELTPVLSKDIVLIDEVERYFTGCAVPVKLKECILKISKEAKEQLDLLGTIDTPNPIKELSDFLLQIQWEFIICLFLSDKDWKFSIKETVKEGAKANVNNGKVIVEDTKENSDIKEDGLYFEGKNSYNIMNFINNIFEFDERFRDFIKKIILAVLRKDEKMLSIIEKDNLYKMLNAVIESVLEKEENENFYREMYKWSIKTGGMVVPVYSIDIYYNMFKRMVRRQNLSDKYTITLNDNELFTVLENLLDEIEAALEVNDNVYDNMDDFPEDDKFANIFITCPFVKKIRNATIEEKERYCNWVQQWIMDDTNMVASTWEQLEELIKI